MGAADRNVNILIKAKDDASKALGGIGISLAAVGAAAAAAAAALAIAAAAIIKVTLAAAEQEQADVKLAFALRSIGENTREARESLNDFISGLQQTTSQGDETIATVVALIAQVGRIGGPDLKRATRATLDLAAAMNIDLKAAAILVAKAAAGDVSALSRYGLKLDESIPKTEKFGALLELLEKNFGGTAEVAGKTFTGALELINLNMGDLTQAIGKGINKAAGLREVLKFVSDELLGLTERVGESDEKMVSFADNLAVIAAAVIESTLKLILVANKTVDFLINNMARTQFALLKFLSKDFKESMASFDQIRSDVISAVTAIDASIDDLQERLKGLRGTVIDVADEVGNLSQVFDLSNERVKDFGTALEKVGLESFEDLLQKGEDITLALEALQAGLSAPIPIGGTFFDQTVEKLRVMVLELNAADVAVQGFINVSAEEANRLLEALNSVSDKSQEIVVTLGDDVLAAFEGSATQGAQNFGSAVVSTAFTGEKAFRGFFQRLVAGFADAIARALALRAILAAIGLFGGGGGGAPSLFAEGLIPGFQRGGFVRGRVAGSDSVIARLTPGEVVLTPEVGAGFVALVQEMRRSRERGGARALSDGGLQMFNRIEPAPDRLQQAIGLVESINELAEQQGMRVVATELVGD